MHVNLGDDYRLDYLRVKGFYLSPTYMIGSINGLIEIKVFTLKFQWFKNEQRSGAVGLVQVLD